MLKRLAIPTLALAAMLAAAVPGVTMARDRDDNRGRDYRGTQHHEIYRGGDQRSIGHDRDWNRGGWNGGFGIYTAPAPVANGYYDQYGNWHPYAVYQPYGPYGY